MKTRLERAFARNSGLIFAALLAGIGGASAAAGEAPRVLLTDDNTITAVDIDGSEREPIVEAGFEFWQSLAVVPALDRMYWGDRVSGQILQANLDGSGVESLVCGLRAPTEIAVDATRGLLYWTDEERRTISRVSLAETGDPEDVIDGLRVPHGVAIDAEGGKLYWTETTDPSIRRADLDGANEEVLVATGLEAPTNIVLDPGSGRMFWGDGRDIKRANLDGTAVEVILPDSHSGGWSGLAIDSAAGRLFFVAGLQVRSADLDGGDVRDVVRGEEAVRGIGVDERNGNVFIVDYIDDVLGAIRLHAGADGLVALVTEDAFRPQDMFVDRTNRKLYWTSDTRIFRSNENGTEVELVADLEGLAQDITVDAANERLFWIEGYRDIWTANLDGSNAIQLAPAGLQDPRDIAIDPIGGKMYWPEAFPYLLRRADLDGGNAETILEEVALEIEIDVTARMIYWRHFTQNTIRRANLDGSGVETVYPNIDGLSSFALDTAARRIYWTQGLPVYSSGYGPIDGGAMVDLGVAGWDIEITTPLDGRAGDIDGDGVTGYADVLLLVANWGPCPCQGPCQADLDGDGVLGMSDLLMILVNWS